MPDLRRSTIAAGLTLSLAVGLAACGANNDDAAPADNAPSASASPSVSQVADETKVSPSSEAEASSTPSASPSPSGPYEPATSKHPARNVPDPGPLPKVARENSKAGRIAFVEHWLKELNYSAEMGSFRDEFWDMTSRECEYCQAFERTFSRMKKDKAWIVGGNLRYERFNTPNEKLDDGNYYVTFSVYEEKRSFFKPGQTEPVETTPPGSGDNGMLVLERTDKGWKIRGFYGAEE